MGGKYNKDCKGGEDCTDERHLCKIAGKRDLELVRKLVKDPVYFCRKCGRAVHDAENVCKPVEI